MKYGLFLQNPKAHMSGIKIIVTYRDKRYTKALGYSIPTSSWDKVHQRVKFNRKTPQFEEVAMAVLDTCSALERLSYKNPEVRSGKHFWEMLDCERNGRSYDTTTRESRELVAYFRDVFIPRHIPLKKFSRITRFKVVLKFLEGFESDTHTKWTFDEVGAKFYFELKSFCARLGYTTSYYNNLMSVIKQVIREASEIDNYHNNNAYRQKTALAETSDKIYLTRDELRAINDLVIDDKLIKDLHPNSNNIARKTKLNSYLNARTLFLIGAHTGLRVSDFTRLRKENITKDNMISIVTQKTGEVVLVPINSELRSILDSGIDLEKIKLSEQKIRAYIKVVAKCAGIREIITIRQSKMTGLEVTQHEKWELISTHTARRSFATNALKSGLKTNEIREFTGQKKDSTLQRYIRITKEENAENLASHPFFK